MTQQQPLDRAGQDPVKSPAGYLLTPSKITAWLDCGHYLTLRRMADAGVLQPTNYAFGEFARLIADKGIEHERAYLALLVASGLDVVEAPGRASGESFEQWAARSRDLLSAGHDVVYQLPLVHDGVRGIADFVQKVDRPSQLGPFSYEPVDAKLVRTEAKPGHVLQLCFYAEALAALQGITPEFVHLHLGSGDTERIRLSTVDAYWRRLRTQLASVVRGLGAAGQDEDATVPRPCSHCDFCEFADHCDSVWRAQDSLHYTAGIRANEQEALKAAGISTMAALAGVDLEMPDLRVERVSILSRQARLQRAAVPDAPPPTAPLDRGDETDPVRSRLPGPDAGDIILDYEGHPFWTPARGLFFLFGYLMRDPATGAWTYHARWAHDTDEEAQQTADLIDFIEQRRTAHPGMHVYHYNHTERSSLENLAKEHGTGEQRLAALVQSGVFVDVLDVVRQVLLVGAESYSLKVLERVAGYERSHEIDQGAGAVIAYDRWCTNGDPADLVQIAKYNEDDVRATLAVRDWLLAGPLQDEDARVDPGVEEYEEPPLDALVAGLMATGEDWKELLAHLLGYWTRERRTYFTQRLVLLDEDRNDRLNHPEVIADLTFVGTVPKSGGQKFDRAEYRFPKQVLDVSVVGGSGSYTFRLPDGGYRPLSADLDVANRRLAVSLNESAEEVGTLPDSVVFTSFVAAKPKPAELAAFAQRVLDGTPHPGDATRVALLQRSLPRFAPAGDHVNPIVPGVAELSALATSLMESTLAVQGPPGTGKTYTGVRLALALIDAGKGVGLTAFSHEAINNFLRALLEARPTVRVLRGGSAPKDASKRLPNTVYSADRKKWDKGTFDIIASTTWMFAGETFTVDAPIDVLMVDEAGQLGLADTLAAMGSARNAILLGDPLQLAQVTQAVHPGGAGASVLEHVLGDHATLPPDRGAFLDTTFRMHPEIAGFISKQIYDGRLRAHPSCATQSVGGEAGLRWVRAEHSGCAKSSEVEAQLVVALVHSLVGQTWIDRHGTSHVMRASDVMVVAPYNEHVNLLREQLDADPRTSGAKVGTVDKFQGQEAPVVVFTMATSDGEHLPRTVDFLFSRNRLNVAVSRARALTYVVCTEELLNTRARTVDEMQLIGTLCSFVEEAQPVKAWASRE